MCIHFPMAACTNSAGLVLGTRSTLLMQLVKKSIRVASDISIRSGLPRVCAVERHTVIDPLKRAFQESIVRKVRYSLITNLRLDLLDIAII